MYYELAVLFLTNKEIDYLLNQPVLRFRHLPGYLVQTINQSMGIKVRPHIFNPIANIPDAFLPCLNEEKKSKSEIVAKIFAKKTLGIIIKGDDISKVPSHFPGFITDLRLETIIRKQETVTI